MSSLNFSSQNLMRAGLFLGGLALGLSASPAHASGPVEAWVGVSVDPDNTQRLMLRYDNSATKTGLVYSEDGGKTFRLMCTSAMAEDAIRALKSPSKERMSSLRSSITRARRAVLVGEGRTLIASTGGLLLDDGTGCSFRDVPELSELWISGLVTPAHAPKVAYVLTNGTSESEREGLWRRDTDGKFTHLWHSPSVPEGENWSNAGLLVGAKPGGGTRVVTTAARTRQTAAGYVLTLYALRSDDDGATFEERELEVPERAGFTLLAIDPTNGDRVLAMFTRAREGGTFEDNRDSLLLSSDGGLTYAPLYDDVTALTSAVFAPDGTLWVSDAGPSGDEPEFPRGLLRFEPGLASPPERMLRDDSLGCVEVESNDVLLLCRRLAFGRYEPTEERFTSWVELTTVDTIHSCPKQNVVADCHDQLCSPGWCGPGHFAAAPLCSAYDEPFCGNNADNYNTGSRPDAGMSGDGDGRGDGDGGDGDGGDGDGLGDGDGGDGDGGHADSDAPDAGEAGDAGQPRAKAQKDGCSCSVQGMADPRGLGAAAWSMSMLLGALLLRRRGRRACARGVANESNQESV